MILHIARRELLHNMMNLRFSLVTILLLALMTANGFIYTKSWQKGSIEEYNSKISKARKGLQERCVELAELGKRGPGRMYRRPGMLNFMSNRYGDSIPDVVWCGSGTTWNRSSISEMWYLVYSPVTDRYARTSGEASDLMPRAISLDWAFIMGTLLSLTAIIFTFDSISGEKERGTLSLVMSNSVSRSTVLLGKTLGAWITLMIPLVLGVLANLLVILLLGNRSFQSGDWHRITVALAISIVYGSVFLMLGIFVSSLSSRSSTSIFTLLLIWVITVVLLPSALGTVSRKLKPMPPLDAVRQNKQALLESMRDKHRSALRGDGTWPAEGAGSNEWLSNWAGYITELADEETKFNNKHVDKQIAQVELAMDICRISPVSVYQYALESMACEGIPRYRDFIHQVRIYARQFADFIRSTDKQDKESHHIYFVGEGMSQKPVSFDSVPKFQDTHRWDVDLGNAMLDIALLCIQFIALFMCAYVAFLRMDIA
ncbi:ABC transporter permease [Candidatus Poribacteria bacterium]